MNLKSEPPAARPDRMISLTPTTTESLFALGLRQRIVGVTAACDFPPAAADVASIGPVFQPDLALVAELRPNLALAHGSYFERHRDGLASLGVELHIFEPRTVDQIMDDFRTIGRLCGVEAQAAELATELRERIGAVTRVLAGLDPTDRPTTLRLLEAEPAIVSGPASFMADCIRLAGGRMPDFGPQQDPEAAYPSLGADELAAINPEAIYLCGWTEEMIDRLSVTPGWRDCLAVREGRVIELPCGLACRPGPRVGQLVALLAHALHPDLVGPDLVY